MKKVLKYLPLAAAALGVIAIVMIFLPAIAATKTETTYTGLQVVFGHSESSGSLSLAILDFSFMNLLTYLLVIVGVVLSVLNWKKANNLFALIATACFVVAAVFFFCTVSFTILSGASADSQAAVKQYLSLGVGSIIGAICSILAAIAAIAPIVLPAVCKKCK